MTKPGTLAWFARHEMRLAWRDWAWLLSGGNSRRGFAMALGFAAFVLLMHGVAYVLLLPRLADLATPPEQRILAIIGDTILVPKPSLSFCSSCAAAADIMMMQRPRLTATLRMDCSV